MQVVTGCRAFIEGCNAPVRGLDTVGNKIKGSICDIPTLIQHILIPTNGMASGMLLEMKFVRCFVDSGTFWQRENCPSCLRTFKCKIKKPMNVEFKNLHLHHKPSLT